jgi:hypothetical protein
MRASLLIRFGSKLSGLLSPQTLKDPQPNPVGNVCFGDEEKRGIIASGYSDGSFSVTRNVAGGAYETLEISASGEVRSDKANLGVSDVALEFHSIVSSIVNRGILETYGHISGYRFPGLADVKPDEAKKLGALADRLFALKAQP